MGEFYENISEMEPMWPSTKDLEEKVLVLLKRSNQLSSFLHPITRDSVAGLLTLMNGYYSNLIEGNPTRPLDIERALRGEFDTDTTKRDLALESKAHVEVQIEFEARVRNDPGIRICSAEFLSDLHRAFYERLPAEFRKVKLKGGGIVEIVPGEIRTMGVEVGRHFPPLAEKLPRFLQRFEEAYDPTTIAGTIDKVLAAAASHHRFAWIHPFPDGNGRVARLLTHFYWIRADLDSNGLWALSRGLARKREQYYSALAGADARQYDDYDGRGNLSQKGLNRFCGFLLDTAIDQVEYMSRMLELDTAHKRIHEYAMIIAARESMNSAPAAALEHVLLEIFMMGEVPRGEIARIAGMPERSARRVTDILSKKNLIVSDSRFAPWRLNFTVESSKFLFPSLFPV